MKLYTISIQKKFKPFNKPRIYNVVALNTKEAKEKTLKHIKSTEEKYSIISLGDATSIIV
jgi:hypothetical protein